MEKTPFAGLSVLAPDDSLNADNSAFTSRDRREIDRGLEIGISTHRHDARPGLANPSPAPSGAVVASGGSIPAGISLTLGYTLEDGSGGETELSPTVLVTTPLPLDVPSTAPSAEASYAAGSLDVDTFSYAVTWIDADGGETPLGPFVTVSRDPGFAEAEIELSGLDSGLEGAGATGWRLYRARAGGEYVRLAEGSGATYTDDGTVEPQCDAHPPTPNENSTNGTSQLLFTIPGSAAIGQSSTWINLYASQAGDFAESCLLAQVPVGSAGQVAAFDALAMLDAQPPDVNRSYDGAHQIDPDTELLDWHWKRPVSGSALLGSGAQGDVRLVEGLGTLYAVLGSAGALAAPGWTAIGSGGAGGGGGEKGEAGQPPGLRYTFKTNVENSSPGIGAIKFNAALSGAPTIMRIHETDADTNAVAAFLATWDDSTNTSRGYVVMRKIGSPARLAIFSIGGALEDAGAYDNFPVTKILVTEAFADSDVVNVEFIRTGDKGEKGEKGETGSAGSTGAEGPAGLPVVMAAGAPGSGTGEKTISSTQIEGTNLGKVGFEGTLDGVTMKAGDWFFHFNGGKHDGIWELTNAGSAATRWVAKRPSGINTSAAVERTAFFVKGGDTYKGRTYMIASTSITLGTTELSFTWMQSRDWGLVSVLPSSPIVGDYCAYRADVAKGIIWHLIYDGEGEFPWKKIGGQPLLANVDTSASVTSATYATAAGGPEITIPLKGDYYVQHGVASVQLSGGASSNSTIALFLGETEKSETEATMTGIDQFEGGPMVSRKVRLTGLTATAVLRQRYRGFANTLAWAYAKRWIEIDPVRVG